MAAEAGEFLVGRTRHFSIFSRLGGAWTIDAGRLLAEAFLIAVATLLAAAIESWLQGQRSPSPPSNELNPPSSSPR